MSKHHQHQGQQSPQQAQPKPEGPADDRSTVILVPSDEILKRVAQQYKNRRGMRVARFTGALSVKQLQPGMRIWLLLPVRKELEEPEFNARGHRVKRRPVPAVQAVGPLEVSRYWIESESMEHEGVRLHGRRRSNVPGSEDALLPALSRMALRAEGCEPMSLKMGHDKDGVLDVIKLAYC